MPPQDGQDPQQQQDQPQQGEQPKKQPTLKELRESVANQSVSLKNQISDLGKQIAQDAIARLGNAVQIDDEEFQIVQRCAERLAAIAVLSIGAPPEALQSLQWQKGASLQALENLAVGKAYAVAPQLQMSASLVLQRAIGAAIQFIVGAGGTALGGPLLGGALSAGVGTVLQPQQR